MLSDVFGFRFTIVTEFSELSINSSGEFKQFFDCAPLIATFLPGLHWVFIFHQNTFLICKQ